MERKTKRLRQNTINKAFISRFCFSEEIERSIWTNINLKLLEPKLKAFAFKLAHNCLPTKYDIWRITRHFAGNNHDPWCNYCKIISNTNVHCATQHIFIHCPLAIQVWEKINIALLGAGMPTFRVNENLVFFRKNLSIHGSYFVTEILWALWRASNYNNYEVVNQSKYLWKPKQVFSIAINRIKFTARVDKSIYKGKVYEKKWNTIIAILEASFAFDNG